jgi:hypothetical protein
MRNEGGNNAGAGGKTATRSTKTMISPWVSEVKRFSNSGMARAGAIVERINDFTYEAGTMKLPAKRIPNQ